MDIYKKILTETKEEFVSYDVKDEVIHPETGEKILKNEDNGVEKYNVFRELELHFDPDVSLRSMLIYEKAFPFVHEGEERNLCQQDDIKYNIQGYKYEIGNRKNRIIYRGDTMNSVATTLNRYYLSFGKDALLLEEALKHINLYHTAGNFMVLPFQYGLNINGQRGIGLSHDYFDLYLLGIYNWYMNIDGEWTLKKIFRTEKNVTFLEEYLSLFKENGLPSWNVFVEKNLFQDWVSLKDGRYVMPKELWEGHFQGNVFPETIEQFESFWINVTENILKRGNRVYKAIHE